MEPSWRKRDLPERPPRPERLWRFTDGDNGTILASHKPHRWVGRPNFEGRCVTCGGKVRHVIHTRWWWFLIMAPTIMKLAPKIFNCPINCSALSTVVLQKNSREGCKMSLFLKIGEFNHNVVIKLGDFRRDPRGEVRKLKHKLEAFNERCRTSMDDGLPRAHQDGHVHDLRATKCTPCSFFPSAQKAMGYK